MAITTLEFVKSYLAITVDTYDTKIESLITKVEADYLDIRNVPFDTDSDTEETVYPDGSDVEATEMIGYKLATTAKLSEMGRNKSSESIDSYRVSYESLGSNTLRGYPLSVVGGIKRFMDGR